ncbi:hypothetical protein ACWF62_17700 [Rhodococcus sp. NPDC054953]
MTTTMVSPSSESPFDALRHVDLDGSEHWLGRELQPVMDYAQWRDFATVINKAKASLALVQGEDAADGNFAEMRKVSGSRGPAGVDFRLTRFGAYLTAMAGDDTKEAVAHARVYFAVRTREAEVAAVVPAPRELAAAGPLPHREQAEILTILRPVLPESYATATGKIILARVMGERPELEPGETPLYAATFLAEKGHKPKTVSRFQSSFGARVSNRYLKVHGRRPEKIPGPAGSRIEKVAVYSEEDRPLLELVYSELAETIAAFEHGGQQAIGA